MKYKQIILLLLLTIFVGNRIFPQFIDPQAKTLTGIKEIQILIEVLNYEAMKLGLTKDRLRTVTELKLRREGIKIWDQFLWDKARDNLDLKSKEYKKKLNRLTQIPNIYINVHKVGSAFSVTLEVHQQVLITRLIESYSKDLEFDWGSQARCTASTWNKGITGMVRDRPEYIIESLAKLLDEFLNDYYKANPKK